MTTITPSPTIDPTSERRLRAVLSLNAGTSFLTGVAGLVAAGWWSDTLGVDSPGWVRIVSAGLLVFAVGVAMVARATPERLRAWAAEVSTADFAWVAASIVLIAAGAFNGTGVAVAVAVGVGVLDFGLLQLWFRRRMAQR